MKTNTEQKTIDNKDIEPAKATDQGRTDLISAPPPASKAKLAPYLSDALIMRFKQNATYQEIATKYNISPQAVSQGIKSFMASLSTTNQQEIESYQAIRKELFNHAEFELLKDMMDEDKRSDAPLNHITTAFKTISDRLLLETGKATANIANQITLKVIDKDGNATTIDNDQLQAITGLSK